MTTIATSASSSLQVAGDNICLLKTPVANVYDANDIGIEANTLLDKSSQRSFLTEGLARSLQLKPDHTKDICLASSTAIVRRLDVYTVYLEIITGDQLPLSVLLVPTIAAPIQNASRSAIASLPYLKGLKLANPLTAGEQFNITLLIGTDYYWQVVENEIVRGQCPVAMKSFSYLLSGLLTGPLTSPTKHSENWTANILYISTPSMQEDNVFWNMESTVTSPASVNKMFMIEYQSTVGPRTSII